MKKFRGILATMLAVVLAVAAVIVYAPTEAYAANTYTCTWKLSYDGTDITGNELTGSSSFVLTTGDEMKVYVTNSGSSQCDANYFCYYKNESTPLDSGDLSIAPAEYGEPGKESVADTGYSSIAWLLEYKCGSAPERIRVEITTALINDNTNGEIKIVFSDADAESGDTASSSNVTTPAHVHTWKYGTIFDATEDTDGLEGYYCSCGANKETTVIPSITAIYKNRYTQMDQAGKGEVITLKMGEWNTYSKEFMQHLISATERGVTVKLDYKYEKKNYVTTVPAGTTMELAYDYYGPLFIQSLFETTKLN